MFLFEQPYVNGKNHGRGRRRAAEGGRGRQRAAEGGRGRQRAAAGGSGSSVDMLDGLIMCGSDFPLLPLQVYRRNSTKAEIYIFPPAEG